MAATSSVWLIVLACIIPALVLAFCYYILVYFQHPDDRNTFYAPKVVVMTGLAVAMVTVLMIPFDVANQGAQFGCNALPGISCGDLGGIRWVWQILFLINALLVAFVIPATLFWYESFDHKNDTSLKACWAASFSQVMGTVLAVAILLVLYFTLRDALVPVDSYALSGFAACPVGNCTALVLGPALLSPATAASAAYLRIGTPFLVFLPGILGFLGWFLFAVYAGIGLVALPLENVRAFVYRPQYIPKDQYARLKLEVQKKTKELLAIGEQMRGKAAAELDDGPALSLTGLRRRREDKRLFIEFKQSVLEIEEHYGDLKMCHEGWRVYNPLIPWCRLAWGIIGALLSLLWVLQIIIYNLARTPYGPDGVPAAYFLNTMFNAASKQINFALIGTILIGLFSFYLLLATMKGQHRFGLRFFVVEIHPLKFGGTYMNSFLVNTSLLLLCVFPLVQFVSSSLQEYVVVTDLDAIFGQQITFLLFFQAFWKNNVFTIAMIAIAAITLLATFVCPADDKAKRAHGMAKRLKALGDQAAAADRTGPDDADAPDAPPPPAGAPPPLPPPTAVATL
jgi:LMBR1 domain-containing protein 1